MRVSNIFFIKGIKSMSVSPPRSASPVRGDIVATPAFREPRDAMNAALDVARQIPKLKEAVGEAHIGCQSKKG